MSRPAGENPALQVDVVANRRSRKWSRSELAGRALWETIGQTVFSWTPRQMWSWRRQILRWFGASIGRDVRIHPTVRIAIPWNLVLGDYAAIGDRAILYSLGRISVGTRATVSQNAHLCAGSHDFRDPSMALQKLPIDIGDNSWVCADAFVGPGVNVNSGAVVGARAVVVRDVDAGAIVAGNPAIVVGTR